jgi:2-dehydropantoate 2-reductase
MMRALVVGAGAVGQVFGYHLAKGGADVTFLVKDKYIDECKRGFRMYPLNMGGRPVHFDTFSLTTEAAGVAWDQVYLTVSSTALRAGPWLDQLARDTDDATIVMLQPSLDDHAYVAARVAPERIVHGGIGFLSYHAPLPGERRFSEPGMAYYLPPAASPFSGARAEAVVHALSAGGLRAKVVEDAARETAFPAAILSAFVAALEAADWSFARMRGDGLVTLGARAADEALRVVAHELGTHVPLAMRLAARPLTFRTILRVGPHVVPTDLETYLRVHFTKVADQMHASMQLYLDRARAAGIATPALSALHDRVNESRSIA